MAGDAVLRESVDGFAVFSSAEPIPAELDLSAIAWAPKEEDAAEAAAAAAAAAAEAEAEEAGSEEAGSDEEDAPAAEPSAPAQEPGVQQPAAADSEPDADSPSESGTPAPGSGGVSFEEEEDDDDEDDEEDDEEEAAVATKAGTERQIIRRSQGVSAAVLFGRPGPIEESEESEDSAADSEADAAAKSPAREDESPEQQLMRASPRGRQEKQVSAKDSGSSSEGDDSSSDSFNDEQPISKRQRAGSLSPTEKIVARKTQQLSAGKQPRAEPEGDETDGLPPRSLLPRNLAAQPVVKTCDRSEDKRERARKHNKKSRESSKPREKVQERVDARMEEAQQYVGRAVAKQFEGFGMFTGTVVMVRVFDEGLGYRVQYLDGDEEDMVRAPCARPSLFASGVSPRLVCVRAFFFSFFSAHVRFSAHSSPRRSHNLRSPACHGAALQDELH